MVFIVQCPKCQKYNLVEEELRGDVASCLACGAKFQLDNPDESQADANAKGSE